jgi:hypothetical protein
MGISTFPAPSTSSTPFPLGASSLVLSGKATDGFYDYTTPLAAGYYVLQAVNLDGGTSKAYAYAVANNVTSEVSNGGTGYFTLTTTESKLMFRPSTVTPTTFTNVMGALPAIPNISKSFKHSNGKYLLCVSNASTNLYVANSPNPPSWTTLTSSQGNVLSADHYNGTYVAYTKNGYILTSINGTSFAYSHQLLATQTASYGLVKYLNGKWHVGADRGTYATSTDGITWTRVAALFPASQSSFYLTFGAGRFVGTGTTGHTATSTDGLIWGMSTQPNGAVTQNVIRYENSLFLMAGASGTLATSTDAVTWTTRTSGFGSTAINAVGYGNGVYIAAGAAGTLTTSTDAVTWTTRTSTFGATSISALTFGLSTYVAAGAAGQLRTSTDAVTWTSRTSTFGASAINGLGFGNSTFIAVGAAGQIRTSTDAITWTTRTSGTANALNTVEYIDSKFWTTGSSIYLNSTDGITWSSFTTSGLANSNASVVWNGTRYLAGAAGSALNNSTDGITWSSRPNGFMQIRSMYDLTYGGGKYIAALSTNTVASTDGLTWTDSLVQGSNAVAYGAGNYLVLGGATSELSTSTDAVTWTTRSATSAPYVVSTAYDAIYSTTLSKFVIAGDWDATNSTNGAMSTDGITWAKIGITGSSSAATSLTEDSIGLYKAIYSAGTGEIHVSTDGTNWTHATAYSANSATSLAGYTAGVEYNFNVGTYVFLIQSGIQFSTTGSNWFARYAPIANAAAIGYNPISKYMMVLGNTSGRVAYTSTDNITWTTRGTISATAVGYSVLWCGGNVNRWVAATQDSTTTTPLYTSTDGNTWTGQSGFGNTTAVAQYIAWDDTKGFIGSRGGTTVVTSSDLSTYTSFAGTSQRVGVSPTLYMYANSSTMYTSTDNVTWTTRTHGMTNTISGIAYGNGLWVVGSTQGELVTSTDAITWTARTLTGATSNTLIRNIRAIKGKFIVYATNSTSVMPEVYLSTDPTTQPIAFYLYSANLAELT